MTGAVERFSARIAEVPAPEGFDLPCWQWDALWQGYGALHDAGKRWPAHRWSYEYHVGPIPVGLQIDHLCRNRGCVNPYHLEPVTSRENVLRGDAPAGINHRKTHCPRGHEFTPDNTWRDRKGQRNCVACKAARDRARSRSRPVPCPECGQLITPKHMSRHRRGMHLDTRSGS